MKKLFNLLLCCILMVVSMTILSACSSGETKVVKVYIEKLSPDMVELSESYAIYNGSQFCPTVTVTSETGKVDGKEYAVTYEDNVNAGIARAIITANADSQKIKGSTEVEFTIDRANITLEGCEDAYEELKQVLDSNNYKTITINEEVIVLDCLTIDKEEEVYFNRLVTDGGTVVNNGILHADSFTSSNLHEKQTVINNGTAYAYVDDELSMMESFAFANYIILMKDIPTPSSPNENIDEIELVAEHMNYEFTIDLNGHNIGVPITFSNVYKTPGESYVLHTYDTGIKASIINSKNDTISSIGTGDYSYGLFLSGNSLMSLNIENVQVYGKTYALVTNGCHYNHDAKLTAKDCVFTSPDTNAPGMGAYLPAAYVYNFINCVFEGATGYYTKNGYHTITNCLIKGTGEKENRNPQGEGGAPTGAAIDIDWGAWTSFPFDMKIYNTTLQSKNNVCIQEYPNWNSTEEDGLGLRDVTRHVEIDLFDCTLNAFTILNNPDLQLSDKYYSANNFVKIHQTAA